MARNNEKYKSETISNGGLSYTGSNSDDYCVESLLVDKKTYRITLNFLEEFYRKAQKLKKIPKLLLGFKTNENQIMMLECKLFKK